MGSEQLTDDQRIRLLTVTMREMIAKGPDELARTDTLSSAERCMLALADCERCWLTTTTMSLTSRELWAELNDIQRAAVVRYLDGE